MGARIRRIDASMSWLRHAIIGMRVRVSQTRQPVRRMRGRIEARDVRVGAGATRVALKRGRADAEGAHVGGMGIRDALMRGRVGGKDARVGGLHGRFIRGCRPHKRTRSVARVVTPPGRC